MNLLAENYREFKVGTPGVWHAMLPRGTSYAIYLPLLRASFNRARENAQESQSQERYTGERDRPLVVFKDSMTMDYFANRDDTYSNDFQLVTRKDILASLGTVGRGRGSMARALYPSSLTWFVDAHDLLEGGTADKLVAEITRVFSNKSQSTPYVLVMHSAMPEAVESKFPLLSSTRISMQVPPGWNKSINLVTHTDTLTECVASILNVLWERMRGVPGLRSNGTAGDYLVTVRTAEDATLVRTALSKVLLVDSKVVLLGPIDSTLEMMVNHPGMAKFQSGVVFSQLLDSYASDKRPQYGLRRVYMRDGAPEDLLSGLEEKTVTHTLGDWQNSRSLYSSKPSKYLRGLHRPGSGESMDSGRVDVGYPLSQNTLQWSSSSMSAAKPDVPGVRDNLEGTVGGRKQTDRDDFFLFVTWADWHYYSTDVWRVSTHFLVFPSVSKKDMSRPEKEKVCLKAACNFVGYRNQPNVLQVLGM